MNKRLYERSALLFQEAQEHIPGGVNSPVRAFRQVGGTPVIMAEAKGAMLTDADGNTYIDYINSWGPMILGHHRTEVVQAVQEQAGKAFSFGAPTELETRMAMQLKRMVPNVDLVRFVSSGTEACMSAVRLARGFTGRNKILKFEGHYHGHADMFLKKAGSGVATLGIKQEGGIPAAVTADTLVLPFNDVVALADLLEREKDELACVIVEPVAGNMGCVHPLPAYLETMRELCSRYGIVLIFDEVMTGFRLSAGGAQQRLNVWADLVTFGKVVGGGLPVGAFGGRRDIMQHIAPLGTVYQAGTLSGNPLAMIAGLTTLEILESEKDIYVKLDEKGSFLATALRKLISDNGSAAVVNQLGSMISLHFCGHEVIDFQTASAGNNQQFRDYFHHCLDEGIYLPPSAFESWFLCDALSREDLLHTIEATERFLQG